MTLSKQFNVFAIIVTYNGSHWVDKCFTSLRNSNYPIKSIVVDNASTDDTTLRIERAFPEVQLIKSKVNHGFGLANNLAIKEALAKDAEFVFLLNQDTWIEPETVSLLVDAMVKNPAYGVVSPLHFGGSGKGLDFGFHQYLLKNYTEMQLDKFVKTNESDVLPADFINAAAWMVSRQTLERVGGFGPLFRHYGEDRDYLQRLKYHGLKLGFIASTKIYHDREGKSFDLSKRDKFVWYYYTGAITRLSNTNMSFALIGLKVFFWCAKDCLYYLLKGRLSSVPAFFEILRKVLRQRAEIMKYRKDILQNEAFLFIR